MSIQVEHLTHTYMAGTAEKTSALNDINLIIEDGELIGLLGHTGSGKTTFVQHLNGLLKPTGGRIIVDGMDLSNKATKLSEVRKKIGLVFQYPEYQLFEETVAKDVAFGPKNLGISGEQLNKNVKEAIEKVGLHYEEIAERSPFELSGGQMRRVAIAGVLAMKPSFLILDEPTAGLDPAGRKSILSLVKELHSAGGMTVMMVSHNMDDISELATRLIVLSHGEVVLDGTPREVFSHEELMEQVGLEIPQAARLANLLRKQGFAIPNGLYTSEEVRDAILRLAGKGEEIC